MRRLSRHLFALAVGLSAATAFAADPVEIAHNPDLATGNSIREVADTSLKQTLTLGGMNIETAVENHAATVSTVGEPTSDGKTTMQTKFEYFIVSIDTPIGKFAFDSGNKSEENKVQGPLAPLNDLFRATSAAEWVSTLNSKPEVEAIEFVGEPFANIDQNLGNEVSPKRFMDEYNNQLRRYPDGPVAVGDKWERTEVSQIGSGQTLTFVKEYTYLGTEEKSGVTFDRIGVKSISVDYEIGSGSQLPLKLESSDLKVASSEGVLLYDRAQKFVTSSTEKLQVTGALGFTISVNGQNQKLPGELDLTIDGKTTAELKK